MRKKEVEYICNKCGQTFFEDRKARDWHQRTCAYERAEWEGDD